jgi:peptidoglycan/xylan/chitin deacetylase (PgdA/CDA1 family)
MIEQLKKIWQRRELLYYMVRFQMKRAGISIIIALIIALIIVLVAGFATDVPASSRVFPMVVITLDDGLATDYTNAFRLASARNIPLTHYVRVDKIGKVGYLSWEQIKKMLAAGDAVECHSYNHRDLTTLTEQEIRAELEAVNAAFEAQGLTAPGHHAYPYGAHNATVRSIVAEYRDTGRGCGGATEIITHWEQDIDWFQLKAVALHRLDIEDIKGLIDDAIVNGKVLIFYTHRVTDDPSDLDINLDTFKEILDYIVSKNGAIEAVTIDTVYSRMMQWVAACPAGVD